MSGLVKYVLKNGERYRDKHAEGSNGVCCILQIIVKDSKQLLRHGKVVSIYDYFVLDYISFNQFFFNKCQL